MASPNGPSTLSGSPSRKARISSGVRNFFQLAGAGRDSPAQQVFGGDLAEGEGLEEVRVEGGDDHQFAAGGPAAWCNRAGTGPDRRRARSPPCSRNHVERRSLAAGDQVFDRRRAVVDGEARPEQVMGAGDFHPVGWVDAGNGELPAAPSALWSRPPPQPMSSSRRPAHGARALASPPNRTSASLARMKPRRAGFSRWQRRRTCWPGSHHSRGDGREPRDVGGIDAGGCACHERLLNLTRATSSTDQPGDLGAHVERRQPPVGGQPWKP